MRRGISLMFCLLLVSGLVFGIASSGGTSANPLITVSYVTDVFGPAVLQESGISGGNTSALRISAQQHFQQRSNQFLARIGVLQEGMAYHPNFQDMRIKRGDAITMQTGNGIIPYEGNVSVSVATGAIIDVTDGKELTGTQTLQARHRYLVAEETTAVFTVSSETAVVAPQGFFTLTESNAFDYNQLASALATLDLFRGNGYAYGEGYQLERQPTRIEALVMFLRLIGEEAQALSYSSALSLGDVGWGAEYVRYAYDMGYTKGTGVTESGVVHFSPNATISSAEYVTFLLRALGYVDSGETSDFQWNTALQFARGKGVLTDGEYLVAANDTFLRAHVAYLSYFSLEAELKNSSMTLVDVLISKGVFTNAQLRDVRNALRVTRL